MASLDAIWIKRARRGPMDPVDSAVLDAARGIRSNADQGGRRQVTIISRERWTLITNEVGASLDPSVRRANLMVSGLDLENSRGRMLRIGAVLLKVNGETRPCERMEEACAGLQQAMRDHWGGGVYAEVVEGGEIRRGDIAEWIIHVAAATPGP